VRLKNSVFDGYNGSILIIPPKKITKRIYICDKQFKLDTLLKLYDDTEYYGLCLISGKETKLYQISVDRDYKYIKRISTVLQKKQKKGGQSSTRIERIRREKYDHHIKKISETIVDTYLNDTKTGYHVKGMIFLGPSETKDKVRNHPLIRKYFSNRCPIIKVLPCGLITDSTIHTVMDECVASITEHDLKGEGKIFHRLQDMMVNDIDKLLFGEKEILEGIQTCIVKEVFVNDKKLKERLDQLNVYGCEIHLLKSDLTSMGNIIGIKYY